MNSTRVEPLPAVTYDTKIASLKVSYAVPVAVRVFTPMVLYEAVKPGLLKGSRDTTPAPVPGPLQIILTSLASCRASAGVAVFPDPNVTTAEIVKEGGGGVGGGAGGGLGGGGGEGGGEGLGGGLGGGAGGGGSGGGEHE